MKILLFLILVACSETISRADKVFLAPIGDNSISVTGPIYGNFGWNIRLKTKWTDDRVIWRSVRPPAIYWAPNGEWFAIEDNLMRLSSAVIVFRVNGRQVIPVYQSPYSDSNTELKFVFEKWVITGDSVIVKMFAITADAPRKEISFQKTLSLKHPEILPNIYANSPDYQLPSISGKKSEKPPTK